MFSDGDEKHPLIELLAELGSVRTIGVEVGNGYYVTGRPNVVKRSYPYHRDIIRAIESLGDFSLTSQVIDSGRSWVMLT